MGEDNRSFSAAECTVCILAGGLGSRLREVVSDRQKAVAEVAGEPFVCRIIRQIAAAGIRRIVLCVGYKAESVEAVLERRFPEVEIGFSREELPLGTAGAVRLALDRGLVDTPRVGVCNGDSWFSADLGSFLRRSGSDPAAMMLAEVEDVSRYGRVVLERDSRRIREFSEKGGGGPGVINAGIYHFDREVLMASIPAGRAVSFERDVFPVLAAERKLYGYPAAGGFIDIGPPESYCRAQQMFKERES